MINEVNLVVIFSSFLGMLISQRQVFVRNEFQINILDTTILKLMKHVGLVNGQIVQKTINSSIVTACLKFPETFIEIIDVLESVDNCSEVGLEVSCAYVFWKFSKKEKFQLENNFRHQLASVILKCLTQWNARNSQTSIHPEFLYHLIWLCGKIFLEKELIMFECYTI